MRKFVKRWDWWLVAILVLAAGLYGWNIWEAGQANDFYTAAIVSMTKSWKAFWYASFDPASFITVDKPPVALWFMAISAKIFGVHGWSVVLPSVLFGIGSVGLIYAMVKPYFGRLAGNLAALFMTITPIVVADSRTNNMDATLVFFLLLAGFLLQRAVAKRKTWLVIVSFALIGVAFNVKMLQAFMLLPAMYFFYWIASTVGWKKKIVHLAMATIALAVFTLAWPVAVDSTNKNSRPYIGSSSTNSVLNLAFGYNGSQRLLGQSTGTGSRFPGMGSSSKGKSGQAPTGTKGKTGTPPSGSKTGAKGTKPTGKKASGKMMAGTKMPGGSKGGAPTGMTGGKQGDGAGGGGGAFNIGTTGPFRLFQQALGGQVSWFFPLALTGLVGAYLYEADRKKRWWQTTHNQQQLWYWAGWLVPVAGFFSIASFFHPYYMIMLAPPLAVLGGIGIATFVKSVKEGRQPWQRYIFAIGLLTTAALQAWYVYSYYPWLSWLIAGGSAITAALIAFVFTSWRKVAVTSTFAITLLSLAPGFWSLTPTIAGESAAIPTAGPDLLTSGGNSGGMGNESANTKLIKYLEKHDGNAKYLFATMDSGTAAPYIIKTGKSVMTIGGFNGTDNAISLAKFKQLVKAGQVKYFYVAGKSTSGSIVNWVKKHGTKISAKTYGGTSASSMMGATSTSESKTISSASKKATKPTGSRQGGQPGGQMPSGSKPSGMKKPSGTKKPSGVQKPSTTPKTSGTSKQMTKPSQKPSSKTGSNKQGQPGAGGMGGNGGTLYKLN